METNNQNLEPEKNQPQSSPVKKMNSTKIYTVVGVVILVLIFSAALAYKFYKPTPQAQEEVQVNNQQQPTAETNPEATPTPYVPQYPVDESLKAIPNYMAVTQKFNVSLTPAQQKFLEDNKFLLIDKSQSPYNPSYTFDDMLTDFDSIGGPSNKYFRAPENTVLVTPDVVLHTYHKFFEMTLEQLEQKELSQTLNDFLTSLSSNLLTASKQSSSTTQERYQNLLAQITVARVLLENKNATKPESFDNADQEAAYLEKDKTFDSYNNAKTILAKHTDGLTPDLISKIQTELQSIYKASGVGSSPLFAQYSDTLQTDYTQFTPRSHYTTNSALRAYFRTMMYLGRSSYFMQKDVGITDTNLLTQQFKIKSQAGITPFDPWQKIMTITAFYAGQSDDITYSEWQNFEASVLGSTQIPTTDLILPANIQKLASSLNQVRLPKILSDVVVDENIYSQTKSDLLHKSLAFRIFGQRFTFDGWVLNDLTAGEEKTDVKLPSTPSALFISAAFGDTQAQKHSTEFLQKDAGFSQDDVTGFLTKLNQKKSDISKVTKTDWFGSMGSAWLYVLGSLTHSYDTNYPKYMQSPAFSDKQIQTFLGSYTELKHDTLLYAKQSYAERGGGGDDAPLPPVVKGFVEPNLDFWNRFGELVSNTKDVFSKNNLFSNSQISARLQNFQDITNFYTSIAQKEIQGQPISEDEYEKLRTTQLSFMVQPFDSSTQADENSGKVALVADVHTDAIKNQILYEADGVPYLMFTIIDSDKTPRIASGLAYNQYEFTNPLGGNRLTDEDWKNWVYGQTDKLPAKNFWYNSLQAK